MPVLALGDVYLTAALFYNVEKDYIVCFNFTFSEINLPFKLNDSISS